MGCCNSTVADSASGELPIPCEVLPHELEYGASYLADELRRVLRSPSWSPAVERARLKNALRPHAAIPHAFRWMVYQHLSGGVELQHHYNGLYKTLLKLGISRESDLVIRHDAHRTLPYMPFFGPSTRPGPGQSQLYRIVTAYTHLDPQCGYTQGMNFVAAMLLLCGLTEEAAFYCFAGLMLRLGLRYFYLPGLPLAVTAHSTISHLLMTKHPALGRHLDASGIHPALYSTPWLLSFFISSPLPPSSIFIILDRLMMEGTCSDIPPLCGEAYQMALTATGDGLGGGDGAIGHAVDAFLAPVAAPQQQSGAGSAGEAQADGSGDNGTSAGSSGHNRKRSSDMTSASAAAAVAGPLGATVHDRSTLHRWDKVRGWAHIPAAHQQKLKEPATGPSSSRGGEQSWFKTPEVVTRPTDIPLPMLRACLHLVCVHEKLLLASDDNDTLYATIKDEYQPLEETASRRNSVSEGVDAATPVEAAAAAAADTVVPAGAGGGGTTAVRVGSAGIGRAPLPAAPTAGTANGLRDSSRLRSAGGSASPLFKRPLDVDAAESGAIVGPHVAVLPPSPFATVPDMHAEAPATRRVSSKRAPASAAAAASSTTAATSGCQQSAVGRVLLTPPTVISPLSPSDRSSDERAGGALPRTPLTARGITLFHADSRRSSEAPPSGPSRRMLMQLGALDASGSFSNHGDGDNKADRPHSASTAAARPLTLAGAEDGGPGGAGSRPRRSSANDIVGALRLHADTAVLGAGIAPDDCSIAADDDDAHGRGHRSRGRTIPSPSSPLAIAAVEAANATRTADGAAVGAAATTVSVPVAGLASPRPSASLPGEAEPLSSDETTQGPRQRAGSGNGGTGATKLSPHGAPVATHLLRATLTTSSSASASSAEVVSCSSVDLPTPAPVLADVSCTPRLDVAGANSAREAVAVGVASCAGSRTPPRGDASGGVNGSARSPVIGTAPHAQPHGGHLSRLPSAPMIPGVATGVGVTPQYRLRPETALADYGSAVGTRSVAAATITVSTTTYGDGAHAAGDHGFSTARTSGFVRAAAAAVAEMLPLAAMRSSGASSSRGVTARLPPIPDAHEHAGTPRAGGKPGSNDSLSRGDHASSTARSVDSGGSAPLASARSIQQADGSGPAPAGDADVPPIGTAHKRNLSGNQADALATHSRATSVASTAAIERAAGAQTPPPAPDSPAPTTERAGSSLIEAPMGPLHAMVSYRRMQATGVVPGVPEESAAESFPVRDAAGAAGAPLPSAASVADSGPQPHDGPTPPGAIESTWQSLPSTNPRRVPEEIGASASVPVSGGGGIATACPQLMLPRKRGIFVASTGFPYSPPPRTPTDSAADGDAEDDDEHDDVYEHRQRVAAWCCDGRACSEWALPIPFAKALHSEARYVISKRDLKGAPQ